MAVARPTAARMIPINSLLTFISPSAIRSPPAPILPAGGPGVITTRPAAGWRMEDGGRPSVPMKRRAPRCRFNAGRFNGKGVHPEVHPLVGLTETGV